MLCATSSTGKRSSAKCRSCNYLGGRSDYSKNSHLLTQETGSRVLTRDRSRGNLWL